MSHIFTRNRNQGDSTVKTDVSCDLLNSVNQGQEDAVRHLNGPCIVIAPPGSGKTFVLTHRIKYLISEAGIDPEHILVITFTRAAAAEMKERFCKLIGEEYTPVTFGTFHAVFFQILKNTYGYNAGNLIRESEKRQYLEEVMDSMAFTAAERENSELILPELTKQKTGMLSPEQYHPVSVEPGRFAELCHRYEQRCRSAGKLDFEDMITQCRELLMQQPEILSAWQERFTYLLIDEFQDINPMQYEIVRLLAGQHHNLFAVGDDDQAIYGFRGSKPEIMLHMRDQYPELREIHLNINYRSQQLIVESASRLIACNQMRYRKQIFAAKAKGEPVVIQSFLSRSQQMEEIVRILRLQNTEAAKRTAIIFRTNSQMTAYVQYLEQNAIPFRVMEKVPNIYESAAARDILAYLETAYGSRERKQFYRIMNKPTRYLSRAAIEENGIDFTQLQKYYREKTYMKEIIGHLQSDLKRLTLMSPFAAVNYIRKGIGYDRYLREQSGLSGDKIRKEMELLGELQESAALATTYADWKRQIQSFSECISEKKQMPEKDCPLTLLTMHGSKGLEYDTVLIPDCNEGVIPHKKAFRPEETEEERRMFYVAMTRAKTMLYLFYLSPKGDDRKDPSHFLQELMQQR